MNILVTQDGNVAGVYNDTLLAVAKRIGRPEIVRASAVEYSNRRQQWEATSIMGKEVIAIGLNREEVIRKEVEHINNHLRDYAEL